MTTASDTSLSNIFRIIADVLSPAGIECLLIGGFAVNAHGYSRATLDVDLMVVATENNFNMVAEQVEALRK